MHITQLQAENDLHELVSSDGSDIVRTTTKMPFNFLYRVIHLVTSNVIVVALWGFLQLKST